MYYSFFPFFWDPLGIRLVGTITEHRQDRFDRRRYLYIIIILYTYIYIYIYRYVNHPFSSLDLQNADPTAAVYVPVLKQRHRL